jgi:uracil-DNA glycosylase family 4
VAWREQVAQEKKRAHANEDYWGKAVPNFGDPNAKHLIVGLAPAAHGANRTGRMFTGDRSGDWLYRALYRAGVANQPNSDSATDGLALRDVLITAVCHCAPPDNKPDPAEIANCRPFLTEVLQEREWDGILCLGGLAWQQVFRLLGERAPKFGHGITHDFNGTRVVGSYHPSQQNTFTGRLTEPMLDQAIQRWLGQTGT